MKLNVGDYVRYKYENYIYIGKIKFISEVMSCLDETLQLDIDNCMEEILKEDIIKSSPNIIDLIEVGDYVNGHKVFDDMRVDTDDYGNDFIEIGIEIDNMLNHYIREEDIKSVLTHEQFEAMQYVVGDN